MSETPENSGIKYEFGKFVLDPQERVLLSDGGPTHLSDKVFDTLLLLVRHNGQLLTKDEMMTSIWQESFVEEGNLAKNISRLRKILNTDGSAYGNFAEARVSVPGREKTDFALGTLAVGMMSGVALYLWTRELPALADAKAAIRLTDDLGNENSAHWAKTDVSAFCEPETTNRRFRL